FSIWEKSWPVKEFTVNTSWATLDGTLCRSTLMTSSSPSPSPVRLSPVCWTEPSLLRSCRNHTWSTRLPPASNRRQDASRSMFWGRLLPNRPFLATASQPRPILTLVSVPPPGLASETFWPFCSETDIVRLLRKWGDGGAGRGGASRGAGVHFLLAAPAGGGLRRLAVPRPVADDRAGERGDDQPGSEAAGDPLGDVVPDADQHAGGQRADRPVRAVLQVHVLVQRALADEEDRQRSDVHGADAEAERDHYRVGADGERADDAVEAERRVQHLQVQEQEESRLAGGERQGRRAAAARLRVRGRLPEGLPRDRARPVGLAAAVVLAALPGLGEQLAQPVDQDVGDHAEHARDHDAARVLGRQPRHERQRARR